DGLVDDLDIFDHVNGRDGFVGEGLELNRAGDGADGGEGFALPGCLFGGSGRAARRRRGHLLLQLIDLLLGGLVAGIDLESALELSESAVEIAALNEDAAAVDVRGGGQE